jgi:hypothetical protein
MEKEKERLEREIPEKQNLENQRRELLRQMEEQKKELMRNNDLLMQKDKELEVTQLSLNQAQLELDNLKQLIKRNQIKLRNTSYISTEYDDFINRMNNIDDEINKLFNHPHNNENLLSR